MKCPHCGKELDLKTIRKLEQKEQLLKLLKEDPWILPCFGDWTEGGEKCANCLVEPECVEEANYNLRMRRGW